MNEPRSGKNIAILILGCASLPYNRMLEAIRRTWGGVLTAGIDIFYVYGLPSTKAARAALAGHLQSELPSVNPDDIELLDEVLIAGCADHIDQQEDCLLRKRLIAFDFLTSIGVYDLIYTVCATSYVDVHELSKQASGITRKRFVSGAISIDSAGITPFISGASMLLSADVAKILGRRRHEIIEGNQFGSRDDVTIGHWIACNLSAVPPETVVDAIKSGHALPTDYILVSSGHTTRDYVISDREIQRPQSAAFHYHFHSHKPGDMFNFHQRYFAPDI